jgi:glutathione peroxidase
MTASDRSTPALSCRRNVLLAAAALLAAGPAGALAQTGCPALLDHSLPRLQDEAPQRLCQFAGLVLLVVNTASYCGYTKQYEGLEKLHARYAGRGFTILGVPSNDFNQEDKDARKIAELCFNTYGVKFPMFTQQRVTGRDAHPLFAQLAKATGQAPRWNFNKYLVDRQGQVVAHYPSSVEPLDARITGRVEQLLAAR